MHLPQNICCVPPTFGVGHWYLPRVARYRRKNSLSPNSEAYENLTYVPRYVKLCTKDHSQNCADLKLGYGTLRGKEFEH